MIEGKGIFSWGGFERRTDRYGSFTLDKLNYNRDASYLDASWGFGQSLSDLKGRHVKIVAEVLESRHSGHCGDLSRKIMPSKPEVGEKIILGIGEFFFEATEWSASKFSVGVRPSDGRSDDWFEPIKLYRLHDQTVVVTIVETDEAELPYHTSNNLLDEGDSIMITDRDEKGMGFMQYKGKAW